MPASGKKEVTIKDFKVVVLGEGRVGKTSLLAKFVHDKFDHREPATVQASPFLARKLKVGQQEVQLSLWDTAGQERFHALGPIYYRDALAALLVFDITDIDSFTRIKAWVAELRQMVGPSIVLVIAANKSDLESERKVSKETVDLYAKQIHATYHDTSAKTGAGLETVFEDIAKRIVMQQVKDGRTTQSFGRTGANIGRRQGGIAIVDEPSSPPSKPQSSCCS